MSLSTAAFPLLDQARHLAAKWNKLTPAEFRVLQAAASGESLAIVGANLFISSKTAALHLLHIREKLFPGAGTRISRLQIVNQARRLRILD